MIQSNSMLFICWLIHYNLCMLDWFWWPTWSLSFLDKLYMYMTGDLSLCLLSVNGMIDCTAVVSCVIVCDDFMVLSLFGVDFLVLFTLFAIFLLILRKFELPMKHRVWWPHIYWHFVFLISYPYVLKYFFGVYKLLSLYLFYNSILILHYLTQMTHQVWSTFLFIPT